MAGAAKRDDLMTERLSKALPSDSKYVSNIEVARKRIASGRANLVDKLIDNEGYADLTEVRKAILKREIEEALNHHHNNPNIRLDDCGFPKDRQDRKFILSHNFGVQLSKIIGQLKKGKWVYLHGEWGLGKTSLATRAIWELLKPHPTSKATYISINNWINDQMPEGEKHTPYLRKLVLLDDFDKFDVRSDFQARSVLRLIEQLKERNSFVLITSQSSVDDLLKRNKKNINLQVMLDRVRGKSVIWNKFTGRSRR
jgi:chromosomal replication initiation ATPase DnaA